MRRLAPLLFLIAAALRAQTPDVSVSGTFNATGNSTPIFVVSGGVAGMVGWRLTYSVDGTSFTAASMAIQGADADTAAGCNSASFANIATATSSLLETANPTASAAQGTVGLKAFYPCIRARLDSVTGSGGTVRWTLNGWKMLFSFPISATITPSGTQDVNLIQIKGVSASTGAGTVDSATLRVTLPSNQSNVPVSQATASALNAQVQGAAASGAAKAGNPVQAGGVFNTTQPTVTTGQAVELQASARGSLLVIPGVEGFPVTQPTAANLNAQVQGAAASGAAKAGNPVQGGSVYNSTQPTVTTGQAVELQGSARGSLLVTPGVEGFIVSITGTPSFNLSQIGGTAITPDPCWGRAKTFVNINLTANTRIITGTSSNKTWICSVQLVITGSATNVALVEGTGSVCGTNTLGLFGGATAATGWNFAANGGLTQGDGNGSIGATTVNANDVCVLVSAANQVSGSVGYVTNP